MLLHHEDGFAMIDSLRLCIRDLLPFAMTDRRGGEARSRFTSLLRVKGRCLRMMARRRR